MPCYAFSSVRPVVHPEAYVHPDAVLIGDCIIGAGSWIGPCAVLRGDMGRIEVGKGANIQEHCALHCFPAKTCIVADHGHIGIAAVLHGCEIGEDSLIGMNSVVMDGAKIGARSIVAAMSFVKSGLQVPEQSLVIGQPAQVKRRLEDKEVEWKRRGTATYHALTRACQDDLVRCEPLRECEPSRPDLPMLSSIRPKSEDLVR